jgi:hypothetical protein
MCSCTTKQTNIVNSASDILEKTFAHTIFDQTTWRRPEEPQHLLSKLIIWYTYHISSNKILWTRYVKRIRFVRTLVCSLACRFRFVNLRLAKAFGVEKRFSEHCVVESMQSAISSTGNQRSAVFRKREIFVNPEKATAEQATRHRATTTHSHIPCFPDHYYGILEAMRKDSRIWLPGKPHISHPFGHIHSSPLSRRSQDHRHG